MRHWVGIAVKAEKVHSGPSGAAVWILVRERACSGTSRALDVYRDKVQVTWFDEGSKDKSWCSKKDAQSHTHCAHPHKQVHADKTLTMQWCVTAGGQPLVRWHG